MEISGGGEYSEALWNGKSWGGGWGLNQKKPSVGGMDIFWNFTFGMINQSVKMFACVNKKH